MTVPSTTSSPAAVESARAFLGSIVARLEPLQLEFNSAGWDASVSGSAADAARRAGFDTQIRALLCDAAAFAAVRNHRAAVRGADAQLDRELEVLEHTLAAHQMPRATIDQLVALETRLDGTFNNFRAATAAGPMSDNALREILQASDDVPLRREAWEASKQVGAAAAPELLELVRLRNEAARALGYRDFYAMSLTLDELDEAELFAQLDRVEAGTRETFRAYRLGLDTRLSARFGISPEQVRPWHMSDPFFQEAPAAAINLDAWFEGRDPVQLAREFFKGIGLELGDLIERADLYEKPGKSQHAFCVSIDRMADVRVLCNLRPNEFWMSVLLHELGHAVYDRSIDRTRPWLLRAPAHTLTTEASAMLFGRLSRNGAWLARWARVDAAEAERAGSTLEVATREQLLVMTRWCLVMCHMERALYADPEQDLAALWWDLVERFQMLCRPEGRTAPDWASKIHFSLAPVYYHNYLLGEMLASQLQRMLVSEVGSAWITQPASGALLLERVYAPGKSLDWRALIQSATGAPLAADAFVAELCAG